VTCRTRCQQGVITGEKFGANYQGVTVEQVARHFLNWASILEDSSQAQVQMTREMPFIFPHVALIPDAHLGKSCAVGAVLPTLGAIMPAAAGEGIGCGIAVRS